MEKTTLAITQSCKLQVSMQLVVRISHLHGFVGQARIYSAVEGVSAGVAKQLGLQHNIMRQKTKKSNLSRWI